MSLSPLPDSAFENQYIGLKGTKNGVAFAKVISRRGETKSEPLDPYIANVGYDWGDGGEYERQNLAISILCDVLDRPPTMGQAKCLAYALKWDFKGDSMIIHAGTVRALVENPDGQKRDHSRAQKQD